MGILFTILIVKIFAIGEGISFAQIFRMDIPP